MSIGTAAGATNEEIQKNELTTVSEEDSGMTEGQSEQAKESLNQYSDNDTSEEWLILKMKGNRLSQ